MKRFMLKLCVVCIMANCLQAGPVGENERRKLTAATGTRINPSDVQLVRFENDHNTLDNYQFNYALSDDQTRDEVGTLKDGKDDEGNNVRFFVVQGSYSFVGDDGQTYWVHYTADESGYHPRVGTGPDPEKKF